ncbi:right-handed parallel beta-helix repeat-containing protein [Paenibacillus xylanexedens]|uniref:right-handed parallel beta-helix repeat-containing protein n=1 Tax=Paenibacillus xylanexedens TaxID=528191 RepID=UPI003D051810
MPQEVFVNSAWIGLPVGTVVGPGMIIGTNAFGTITEGVAAVANQGTVQVAAGVYNESVDIDKPLQLHGAQYGVDARTRSGNPAEESVVQSSTDSGIFFLISSIESSSVVIDGFTIQNNTLGTGINANGAQSGFWFLNNIIQNNTIGLYLNSNGSIECLVQQNLINNNNQAGPGGGNGIYSDQGFSNALIDNNKFTNNQGTMTLLGGETTAFENVIISNNEIITDGGIFMLTCQNISILNNTISNNTSDGIFLSGGNDRITILNNILQFNTGNAINVQLDFTAVLNSNIRAKHNSIVGNTVAGLTVATGSYNNTAPNLNLDATNNWWGDPSGPNVNGGGPGTGQAIIDPDLVTLYIPFLVADPFVPTSLITPVQRLSSSTTNVYVAADRDTAVAAANLGTGTLAVEVAQFPLWSILTEFNNDNNPVFGAVPNPVIVWDATTAPGQVFGFAAATDSFTFSAAGEVLINLTAFADNAMEAQIDLVDATTNTIISTPPLGVLLLDGSMDPTPVVLDFPFNWQNIRFYSIPTGPLPAGEYKVIVSFTVVNYLQYMSYPDPAGLSFVADVYTAST